MVKWIKLIVWIKVLRVLEWVKGLEEIDCDFSSGEGSLEDKHISICRRYFNKNTRIEVICPKNPRGKVDPGRMKRDLNNLFKSDLFKDYREISRKIRDGEVNLEAEPVDEEFTILPKGDLEFTTLLKDELQYRTKLERFGVWEIFGTMGGNVLSRRVERDREIVTLKPPEDGILTLKARKIIVYFCIQESNLAVLDSSALKLMRKWLFYTTNDNYGNLHVPILGQGDVNLRVGVAIIIPESLPELKSGCGNVPNKLFNTVPEYDPVSGVTECKFDVMTEPDIGFYCNKIIQPFDCLRRFYNLENDVVIKLDGTIFYNEGFMGNKLVYAEYRNQYIHKPFRGYCTCVDEHGKVLAKITVERKTRHVFDISPMLMKNRVKPIKDDWFSVMLHPGDELKIIIPPNVDNINYFNYVNRDKRAGEPGRGSVRGGNGRIGDEMENYRNLYYFNDSDFQLNQLHDPVQLEQIRQGQLRNLNQFNEPLGLLPVLQQLDDPNQHNELNQQNQQQQGGVEQGDPVEEVDEIVVQNIAMQEEIDDELESSDNEFEVEMETETDMSDFETYSKFDFRQLRERQRLEEYAKTERLKYPFVTYFSPTDLENHVSCMNYNSELVTRVPMVDIFGGNAYSVDASQLHRGLITIRYDKKPLSLKTGTDDLYYYWMLRYRRLSLPEIVVKINVTLAQTHHFCVGCETEHSGLFYSTEDCEYCEHHFNSCQKKGVKTHVFDMANYLQYGIYCKAGEILYPIGSGSRFIDAKSGQVVDESRSMRCREYPNLRNLKIFFKRGWTDSSQVTLKACCLNSEGIELSRLVIYTAKYETHSQISLMDGSKVIFVSKVPMFLPPFDSTQYNMRTSLTSSVPETEFLALPKGVLKYQIELREGRKVKLNSVIPRPLDVTTELDLDLDEPAIFDSNYTLKGVRTNKPRPEGAYTDPSLSNGRLFPANITKYFYRLVESKTNFLIPAEYKTLIATNVAGLKIKVKHVNGNLNDPTFETLFFYQPVGSVVILKQEGLDHIDLIYASGAISPSFFTNDNANTSILTSNSSVSNKPSVTNDNTGVSNNANLRDSMDMGQSSQVDDVKQNVGVNIGKNVNISKNNIRKSSEVVRDVRRMEIWGLFSVRVRATNPWVHGCGVTEPSEDFFRPETEKIEENGRVVGCKVDLSRDIIAGFYCPEPYQLDPPECFNLMYVENSGMVVQMKREFDGVTFEVNGFKYIKRKMGIRSFIGMFQKLKTYTCYCRSIFDVKVTKIQILT